MKRRVGYFDIARGLAIFLVVLGHAIQYSIINFDDNFTFRLIYAVHMPLFMFISGYVTLFLSEGGGASLNIKVRQLLFPFVAWLPISYLAILFIQQPDNFRSDFFGFILSVFKAPDAGGLWFLLVLFECHLVIRINSLAGPRYLLLLNLAVLLALNVVLLRWPACNWLGLGLLRWQFLFFLLGFTARHFGWQPPRQITSWVWMLVFIGLAFFWYRKSAVPVDLWLPHLGVGGKRLAVQGYHALTAVAGIVATLGLCAASVRSAMLSKVNQAFEYLGRTSLEVYAGHYLFLYMALSISNTARLSPVIRVVFVAAFALLGAKILANLVSRQSLLRRAFYGR